MAFEGGNLNLALAAAVGDDASLVRDLRRAFLESADRQVDLLFRANDESAWHLALWRLKGLCGSFGVVHHHPAEVGFPVAAIRQKKGNRRAMRPDGYDDAGDFRALLSGVR